MTRYLQLLNKISIHPLFWFIVAIGLLTGYFKEIIMLLTIVFIHEMGHAVTAHFFRWRIKKIQLLPFGGVAEVEEHGNRPIREEILVILAGPIQHMWLIPAGYLLASFSFISEATLATFIFHNIVILGFNLLPIWPLDGGKLLFALLSLKHSFSRAHRLTLTFSGSFLLFLSFIILFAFPFHLNYWIIVSFLVFAHYIEWKQRNFVQIRFLLERYYGKNNDIRKLKPITVQENDLVFQVISNFYRGCKHQIVMQRENDQQETLDENELLHAYFTEKRTTSTIGEIVGV